MSAVAWFFLSGVVCAIASIASIFIVTTHKGLNAWICCGFFTGAIFNDMLILAIILKPAT